MEYEGRICRTPMERSSFMLPIMVGCSYNKCKFCNLFKDIKYRKILIRDIEKELLRVRNLGGCPRKIFLGDGAAFDCNIEHLSEVLHLIRFYFPQCLEINMDSTIQGILKKTDDELMMLYSLGVRHLYIGIETGLDDILLFMKKDHNLKEAYIAIERIKDIGYFFDAHIMTGIAGYNRGIENAHALSLFFEKTSPTRIVNFSMFIHNEVSLFRDIEEGNYIPSDELSCLKEEECLIRLLWKKTKSEIEYEGFHDFIEWRVRGRLPKDCERMLLYLQEKIAYYEKERKIYALVRGKCEKEMLEKIEGKKVWAE